MRSLLLLIGCLATGGCSAMHGDWDHGKFHTQHESVPLQFTNDKHTQAPAAVIVHRHTAMLQLQLHF